MNDGRKLQQIQIRNKRGNERSCIIVSNSLSFLFAELRSPLPMCKTWPGKTRNNFCKPGPGAITHPAGRDLHNLGNQVCDSMHQRGSSKLSLTTVVTLVTGVTFGGLQACVYFTWTLHLALQFTLGHCKRHVCTHKSTQVLCSPCEYPQVHACSLKSKVTLCTSCVCAVVRMCSPYVICSYVGTRYMMCVP